MRKSKATVSNSIGHVHGRLSPLGLVTLSNRRLLDVDSHNSKATNTYIYQGFFVTLRSLDSSFTRNFSRGSNLCLLLFCGMLLVVGVTRSS